MNCWNEVMVSIIIPIFNAERTLDRCLQSVINQSYENIEIILINDGSTDRSLSICEDYRKKDGRIIVVNKENGGASSCRNIGIFLAGGKYIQFVDSDDWLSENATEQFLTYAEFSKSDLVVADFFRVKKDSASVKGHIKKEGCMTTNEYVSYMSQCPANFYYGVIWNKFYKRDIIQKNEIFMDREMKWCEDFLFNLQYLRYVRKCYTIKKPLYYYVDQKNSLVKQNATFKNMLTMKKQIWEPYKEIFEKLGMYDNPYEKLQVAKFMVAKANDGNINFFTKQKIVNDENK